MNHNYFAYTQSDDGSPNQMTDIDDCESFDEALHDLLIKLTGVHNEEEFEYFRDQLVVHSNHVAEVYSPGEGLLVIIRKEYE